MEKEKLSFLCVDLKSFYASVECIERGLDPLKTNLVVGDESRTDKSICLAVTPTLKAMGVKGRPRLFEAKQKVKEINAQRRRMSRGGFNTKSYYIDDIENNRNCAVDFIIAPPRMAFYIEYSALVFSVYLKYVAMEDIHVYSIDEVFMDIREYIGKHGITPQELASVIIKDVLDTTGITATGGLGSNAYLAKVAMDILAKHSLPDENGCRIAALTEQLYKQKCWTHKPITDFWRVGKGYANKLALYGMETMGDVARCSLENEIPGQGEDLLYKLLGVNAELLIDHAWGIEPCTMKDIKSYHPTAKSLGSGQVLHSAYTFEKAKIVLTEMVENLALSLVEKKLMTKQIMMSIGYDIDNLNNSSISAQYKGAITIDAYGRKVPKHTQATINFHTITSSQTYMVKEVIKKFDEVVNPILLIRRINLSANNIVNESFEVNNQAEQLDLFTDFSLLEEAREKEKIEMDKDYQIMKVMNEIKHKYGKNLILKATSLTEGATQKERNEQIGGHKS